MSNAAGSIASGNATLTVTSPVGNDLIVNGSFENGTANWITTSGIIGQFGAQEPAYAGTWGAWLGGVGSRQASTATLGQTVAIPGTTRQAILAFRLHVDSRSTDANATFQAQVRSVGGTILATLAT